MQRKTLTIIQSAKDDHKKTERKEKKYFSMPAKKGTEKKIICLKGCGLAHRRRALFSFEKST